LTGRVRGSDDYALDIVRQPVVYDDGVSLHLSGLGAHDVRHRGTFSRDLRITIPV
jgi:hypothetical protein